MSKTVRKCCSKLIVLSHILLFCSWAHRIASAIELGYQWSKFAFANWPLCPIYFINSHPFVLNSLSLLPKNVLAHTYCTAISSQTHYRVKIQNVYLILFGVFPKMFYQEIPFGMFSAKDNEFTVKFAAIYSAILILFLILNRFVIVSVLCAANIFQCVCFTCINIIDCTYWTFLITIWITQYYK